MDEVDWEIKIGTKREKGKAPVPIMVRIPAEQKWMYHMLNEQQKTLDSIKSWITFMGIITLLGIIVGACSVLGSLSSY